MEEYVCIAGYVGGGIKRQQQEDVQLRRRSI